MSNLFTLQEDYASREILLVEARHNVRQLQTAWHVTKVYKYKNKGPQSQQAQVADADSQEEKLFIASCFSSQDSYNA